MNVKVQELQTMFMVKFLFKLFKSIGHGVIDIFKAYTLAKSQGYCN